MQVLNTCMREYSFPSTWSTLNLVQCKVVLKTIRSLKPVLAGNFKGTCMCGLCLLTVNIFIFKKTKTLRPTSGRHSLPSSRSCCRPSPCSWRRSPLPRRSLSSAPLATCAVRLRQSCRRPGNMPNRSWEKLLIYHTRDELGAQQARFVPGVISPFVELTLLPHKGIRSSATTMLFSVIFKYYEQNKSMEYG